MPLGFICWLAYYNLNTFTYHTYSFANGVIHKQRWFQKIRHSYYCLVGFIICALPQFLLKHIGENGIRSCSLSTIVSLSLETFKQMLCNYCHLHQISLSISPQNAHGYRVPVDTSLQCFWKCITVSYRHLSMLEIQFYFPEWYNRKRCT